MATCHPRWVVCLGRGQSAGCNTCQQWLGLNAGDRRQRYTHPHLPSTVTVADTLPADPRQGRGLCCAGTDTSAPASSSQRTTVGSKWQHSRRLVSSRAVEGEAPHSTSVEARRKWHSDSACGRAVGVWVGRFGRGDAWVGGWGGVGGSVWGEGLRLRLTGSQGVLEHELKISCAPAITWWQQALHASHRRGRLSACQPRPAPAPHTRRSCRRTRLSGVCSPAASRQATFTDAPSSHSRRARRHLSTSPAGPATSASMGNTRCPPHGVVTRLLKKQPARGRRGGGSVGWGGVQPVPLLLRLACWVRYWAR